MHIATATTNQIVKKNNKKVTENTAARDERRGVDAGDPDGLWKPEFAEQVLKSIEEHRSGKAKLIPYSEVRKLSGLAD